MNVSCLCARVARARAPAPVGKTVDFEKAAANALCLIKRGLGIRRYLQGFYFVGAPLLARVSRTQAHRRACDTRCECSAGRFFALNKPGLCRCHSGLVGRLAGPEWYAKTWLILPVVICLSQRLSHACLSISFYTVKLRMAH